MSMSIVDSLRSAIKSMISSDLDDIRICLPVKILDYDSEENTASVEFYVGRKMVNGQQVPLAIIENVPILFFGNSRVRISFKPEAGDDALLLFCDVDISSWVYRQQSGEPESIRRFNINDCYAVLTKTTTGATLLGDSEVLNITAGDSTIIAKNDGSVLINGHLEIKI